MAVHDDVCEKAEEVVCGRLRYAVAVGALGIAFSLVSILATMFGFMGKWLEIGSSVLSAIFFFFGVGTLFIIFLGMNCVCNIYKMRKDSISCFIFLFSERYIEYVLTLFLFVKLLLHLMCYLQCICSLPHYC